MKEWHKLLAQCGEDVRIEFANFRYPKFVKLGDHVAIDAYFHCTTQLAVGDYVQIGPHVSVIGGSKGRCEIGNFCSIAAGARLICATRSPDDNALFGPSPCLPESMRPVICYTPIAVGDFVEIGTNSVIMPGVTLAEGTIVGACSFVRENTLPWTVYWGIPAKPRRKRDFGKIRKMARALGY